MTTTASTRRRAWTVQDYMGMHAAGVLTEDDRVELLEGEVVEKVVIGSRHAGAVNRLNRLLVRLAGDDLVVSVQNPVVVGTRSQPEPDLAVLLWRDDLYAAAHPRVEDVILLVEVADSSAGADRRRKIPMYAAGGVPELWLVDVEADVLERYREPAPSGYARRERLMSGDVAPDLAPTLQVAVGDLLG